MWDKILNYIFNSIFFNYINLIWMIRYIYSIRHYLLFFPTYLPVSVEIIITSPSLINIGVSSSKPVSTVTFFCGFVVVLPLTASGAVVTVSEIFGANSISNTSSWNFLICTSLPSFKKFNSHWTLSTEISICSYVSLSINIIFSPSEYK
ncbi:Hypothetical protein MCYN_0255 [Mycoplasmopsis cynos C142]|uniref:Uncharacterized protein n=1 Tax=Mycoplasmopsis cynos (strain C142) TaxID=1246955 RepID=L0RV98_MYCC1|nr:Hypothetical protein MCYN_0255 [Mycoplasmopsis cynos C142]